MIGDHDNHSVRHAKNSQKRSRLVDMITIAQSEEGIPILEEDFDRNEMLLNCQNGIIDLTTGELLPHDRDKLMTKIIPASYDPDALCPEWDKFLDTVSAGEKSLVNYIRKAVGYSLTGKASEQVLFIIKGPGGNGKSTFLNAISELMGGYAANVQPESFSLKKAGYTAINNDIARLKGIRFVTSVEIGEGRKLDESLIKSLTGQDKLTARFLNHEYFEFLPQCKIWIGTNNLPNISSGGPAIWRRVHLIFFNVVIPEEEIDYDLPNKLRAELDGILAWAVKGCLQWQKLGLKPPKSIRQATDRYQEEMDITGQFIASKCTSKPGCKISMKVLYDNYSVWCEYSKETPLSKRTFNEKLREKGFNEQRGKGNVRYWLGLGVKEQ